MILIAGPCVVENYETTYGIASYLKDLTKELGIPFIFKASYDKANRTSINSFRGAEDALGILWRIKKELDVQITSDIHRISDVVRVSRVLDVVQIPAFLCRQTDLLVEVGRMGKPVNVKKGQFMSPWEMKHVVDKVRSTGNNDVTIIERGTTFGYNNLVVDMRSIGIMKRYAPVVFDATHSVQLPGGKGSSSGGQREFVPILAKAAVAGGADGVFMEVHPDPDNALCDGPNSLNLRDARKLVVSLKEISQLRN
jgi:2-dehydro-3-deoxyphosphooctonate aldolase (KDO 8-P synthase)